MRVKKDHFRDKTICVGMAMRQKEKKEYIKGMMENQKKRKGIRVR